MWYNLPISTKSQKARCIRMSHPTEKAQNSLPLIKKEHRNKVLITLFVLTVLAGAGYWAVIAVTSGSAPPLALVLRLAYVAILYMPVPLYTLLLSRFMLRVPVPFRALLSLRQITAKRYALVAGLFLAWAVLMVGSVVILGWLWPETFGHLATTNGHLVHNLEKLIGTSVDASAINLPPTPLVMLPLGIVGALMAWLTVNAIFAMTEEIMWRGYLAQAFAGLSFCKKYATIGVLWGLWHIPLIALGYNYGAANALPGVVLFVGFCVVMSLVLGFVVERTRSVWLAAVLHGTFNGFSNVMSLLVVGGSSLLASSVVGVVSLVVWLVVFLGCYISTTFIPATDQCAKDVKAKIS